MEDNKIVSFISSLPLVRNGTTMPQCGSKTVSFSCPKAFQPYIKYMGYVDLVDFDKKIGGSFTENIHFKKWYTRGYLGFMDFILVNGHIAWNMSDELKGVFRTTLNTKNILNLQDLMDEKITNNVTCCY